MPWPSPEWTLICSGEAGAGERAGSSFGQDSTCLLLIILGPPNPPAAATRQIPTPTLLYMAPQCPPLGPSSHSPPSPGESPDFDFHFSHPFSLFWSLPLFPNLPFQSRGHILGSPTPSSFPCCPQFNQRPLGNPPRQKIKAPQTLFQHQKGHLINISFTSSFSKHEVGRGTLWLLPYWPPYPISRLPRASPPARSRL